ncbi:MAG: 50S ribosomal protein L32 [Candidatus Gracilibacteria bacterium]|jgi:large subunit ribosomal protein L32
MGKKPVPKKKTSVSRSKKRYGSFKTKTLQKLSGLTALVSCPNCKGRIPSHRVCPDCGMYRGRQVVDQKKKIDKITKVKV